jgi:hypothetical protein
MADIALNLQQDAVCEIERLVAPRISRPFVPVIMYKKQIKGLYDTGADVSCLDEKIFREIPIQDRPKKIVETKRSTFTSASGDKLNINGKYLFPLQIGTKKIQHEIFVVKNLNEKLILGIDFIQKHQLNYRTDTRSFNWNRLENWNHGRVRTRRIEIIEGLSINTLKLKVETENGFSPKPGTVCMVNIHLPSQPGLTGGPFMTEIDQEGNLSVPVTSCYPSQLELPRGEELGIIENIQDCEKRELNPEFVNAVNKKEIETKINSPLSASKKKFIEETAKLETVPENFRERYLQLLFKYHEAISQHKFDLGRSETLLHDIALKSEEPIYVKQFKIPDAHREEVERHVAEWLKLGVVQPCRSKFNSPLFVVMKKNGGVRLVQDFRALNAQTYVDKYSMKDVGECISEIGRSGSTIFTTIDLTAGFWQMLLHPRSRAYTAFTLPGKGQFQWVTAPMGLLGSPSSFQRLMETVMHNLENVLVYIDDLLLHSHDHESHLATFEKVLKRMVQHGLKLNLEKCVFGSKEVGYLGFRLTEAGIKPGIDKLKAVSKALPPSSVKEVRQFLGLCNFFRNHVRNFSQLSAPLTEMIKKESKWKGGELPAAALKAFRELQSYLCSEPVVDYPRKDRAYALITDASFGDEKKIGGLGAILAQVNKKGEFFVIAYASRGLQKHEKNYTPFLLEMQAALWGMDHFSTYLRGRHFTLFTDHKPLEKLGKVHTKTLNRLQEAMNQFDFEIIYKKGSEMPADFLSRNVVASVSLSNEQLVQQQDLDPFIKVIKAFLLNRQLPSNPEQQNVVKRLAMDCFIEDDLVWRRIKRSYEPSRVVLLLPQNLKDQVMQQAHGTLMAGHDGVLKTKERILSCYYWNGMDQDINQFIKNCHKCQIRRPQSNHSPALLTPLPQGTEPNQRVHADLFGPLRASDNRKKYILCMTDAFTKYVELVALENKEASTVTTAMFEKWFCRYGIPSELVTDGGKEFCAKISEELFKKLGALHTTTTPHHPQCNSQAEVANKTIAKYLASFVDDSTLNWEDYLAPLMFCYNTSFHRSIKTTPFFVTYGIEPRQPGFPQTELRRKFYGESTTDELLQRLRTAREVARLNNEDATMHAQNYYDQQASAHPFKVGQLVLLNETYFLHKNAKLAPKWTGPHRITKLKGPNNAEIQLQHNNKRLLVHTDRLKVYNTGHQETRDFPDFDLNLQPKENFPKIEREKLPNLISTDEDFYDLRTDRPPQMGSDQHSSFFGTPKASRAQEIYQNLPSQQDRPSNILVRLGPPTPHTFENQGGVQEVKVKKSVEEIAEAVAIVNAIDEVAEDNNDDSEGWILVTRRKSRRRSVKQDSWTAQQKRNFVQTGDIYESPSSFKYSQYTHEDEPANIPIPQQQLQLQPQQQQPPQQQLPPQQPQQPQPQQPQPVPQQQPPQPQPQQPPQQQRRIPLQHVPGPAVPAVPPNLRPAVLQYPVVARPRSPIQQPQQQQPRPPEPSGQQQRAADRLLNQNQPDAGDRRGEGYSGTGQSSLPTHKSVIRSRSSSPRFQPYDPSSYGKSTEPGPSQILFRLQSPVRDRSATVVPGLPDPLSSPPISIHTQSGQPKLVSTDIPLRRQGWIGDSSSGSVFEPRSPVREFESDPSAPPEAGPSKEGQSPTPSPRSRQPVKPSADYENVQPGSVAQGGARPKVTPDLPKPILKKTNTAAGHQKKVQYSPSTKRGRPISTKRPPTPDIEVSIRPTSNWDILDEVLAGQPTRIVDGRTIPDTLIQISEPTPHDQAKKAKKTVARSDRILRSTKNTSKTSK